MKNATVYTRPVLAGFFLLIVMVVFAWQVAGQKTTPGQQRANDDRDTTQSRKHRNDKNEYQLNGDFDEAMRRLNMEMKQLDERLAHLDVQINKQVQEALARIDFDKISRQTADAMKNIDWQKIQLNVNQALQKAQREMEQVKMEELNTRMKELETRLKSDSFRLQLDTKHLDEQVQKSLSAAKGKLREAQGRLEKIKSFTDALEKDGLINTEKGYRLELKEGSLYINGVQQSKAVTEKYRKYYPNEDHFSINHDGSDSITL